MRSIEDKGCLNNTTTTTATTAAAQENIPASGGGGGTSCMSFEFHKSSNNGLNRTASSHHRTALGKQPTPSKWDDAQKWLVNLSRGERNIPAKASPRNSNADDRRLIAPVPDEGVNVETKNVDIDESIWKINYKPANNKNNSVSKSAVRSVCVRDMGTEMTPIASLEPSRTATPIRATTPAVRSPVSSGASTPARCTSGAGVVGPESGQLSIPKSSERRGDVVIGKGSGEEFRGELNTVEIKSDDYQSSKTNPLEIRAVAWDEAERAKYMARYKREEVKIQAWENHQKRKAEMEMRKIEVKAETLKSRAQEKYTNKIASTRRIAEEKRANAEAKLNEKAVKTSQRADYIRRTGHLPSSFSFYKLPSFCW
ncbi:hypothetical protein ABFS83_11G066800 [Erythranthe nasuta]